MANYTRKAILRTFEEMLEEMPFEKITVTALVARCEISSNTFYYHFRDIFDLLDSWLDAVRDRYVKETAQMQNWTDRLKVVLHDMQNNPKLVYHIFNSISRERLEHYVFTSVEGEFYEYVKTYTDGLDVPDETARLLTGFFCYSLLGYFLKFLWINMDTDVDAAMDALGRVFQNVLDRRPQQTSDLEEQKPRIV